MGGVERLRQAAARRFARDLDPLTPGTAASADLELIRPADDDKFRRNAERLGERTESASHDEWMALVDRIPFGAQIIERTVATYSKLIIEWLAARPGEYATDPRLLVATSEPSELFDARIFTRSDGSATAVIGNEVVGFPGYLHLLGLHAGTGTSPSTTQMPDRVLMEETDAFAVAALRTMLLFLIVDGLAGRSRPAVPRGTARQALRVTHNGLLFVIAHEFAHALLGHPLATGRQAEHELEADRMALEIVAGLGRGAGRERRLAAMLNLMAGSFTADRVRGLGRPDGYPPLGERLAQVHARFPDERGGEPFVAVAQAAIVERNVGALPGPHWEALQRENVSRSPVAKLVVLDQILGGPDPTQVVTLSEQALSVDRAIVDRAAGWLADEPATPGAQDGTAPREPLYERARSEVAAAYGDRARDDRSILTAALIRARVGGPVLTASPFPL